MLCVMALKRRVSAGQMRCWSLVPAVVLALAVSLLAQLDYPVVAVTPGRAENHDYLTALGASQVIPRDEFAGLQGAGQAVVGWR